MGAPGKAKKVDVVQKKVSSNSETKTQLGSECHPRSTGLVYLEILPELGPVYASNEAMNERLFSILTKSHSNDNEVAKEDVF